MHRVDFKEPSAAWHPVPRKKTEVPICTEVSTQADRSKILFGALILEPVCHRSEPMGVKAWCCTHAHAHAHPPTHPHPHPPNTHTHTHTQPSLDRGLDTGSRRVKHPWPRVFGVHVSAWNAVLGVQCLQCSD